MRRRPSLAMLILDHSKAFGFSALTVGLVLALPGLMTQPPLNVNATDMMLAIQSPSVMAAALEAEIAEASAGQLKAEAAQVPASGTPPVQAAPEMSPKPTLPEGFTGEWETVALDQRIQLELLKKGFPLKRTWRQSGSEYFTYGAYLFDEIAAEIKDPDLARQLKLLSVLAETMGHSIRQASSLNYDGAPSTDMSHLQVRSSILFHLDGLRKGSLKIVDLDQHGNPVDLGGTHVEQPDAAGETLQAFLNTRRQILDSPLGKQYPQTMALIEQQANLLEQLARHMETRWESTFYCNNTRQGHCDGMATYMRVYARQNLPSEKISTPDVRISLQAEASKQ